MSITLSLKSVGAEPVDLAKVVISMFPGCPSEGKVTMDIEFLQRGGNGRAIEISLLRDGNGESSSFEGYDHWPYEDTGNALASYLKAGFVRINENFHLDQTRDERHLVRVCRTSINAHRNSTVWSVRPEQPTETWESQTIPAEVTEEVKNVDGYWLRLVTDGHGTMQASERLSLKVESRNINCYAMYIWQFAPKSYAFVPSDGMVQVFDGQDARPRERPPLLSYTQELGEDDHTEFEAWRGRVIGKQAARTARAIHWNNQSRCVVNFVSGFESRRLTRKFRRSYYYFGAAIAVLGSAMASSAIQYATFYAKRNAGEDLMLEVSGGFAVFFLVVLMIVARTGRKYA